MKVEETRIYHDQQPSKTQDSKYYHSTAQAHGSHLRESHTLSRNTVLLAATPGGSELGILLKPIYSFVTFSKWLSEAC